MASLNTNVAAMTALQTLTATNKNLATTQSRISTGFRVGEAMDNAAYWSIATTMRSDNKAFSSVQDALGLGAGKLDVAYTGMNAAIEVVDEIKQKLISALGASDEDKGKIQSEITELQNQLKSITKSANFAGSNLLTAPEEDVDTLEIVASYDRASNGAVSVNKISVSLVNDDDENLIALMGFDDDGDVEEDSGLLSTAFDLDDFDEYEDLESVSIMDIALIDDDGDAVDDDYIQGALANLEIAMGKMTEAASNLGAAKKRVDMQSDFVSKLQDAIDRGVGQLVDADMQAESARLSALQVQQQLGIQSLSIANANAQNILSLFR
jgi:flagellin